MSEQTESQREQCRINRNKQVCTKNKTNNNNNKLHNTKKKTLVYTIL